ncbi:MAG: multiheme c-type cytochrome [Bacteroidota bacterium]|nr:multiheme c-type cytochrome [Bacteroidota bacterium]
MSESKRSFDDAPRSLHGGGLLLATVGVTAAYLWGTDQAHVLYLVALLVHLMGGLVLAWVWTRSAISMLRCAASPSDTILGLVFLLAAWSGLAILVVGRIGTWSWLLPIHIGSAMVATVALLGLKHIPWRAPAVGALILALVAGVGPRLLEEDGKVMNDPLGPISLAEHAMGGEDGPFFPSSVHTDDGELIPSEYFMESQGCGRSGCHEDAVMQWEASAHHFSSFNNQWYRKSIEYMQEVGGVQRPQWCAGCHDPALLFSGQMDQPVEDFIDDPAAHAGIGCVACHTIKEVRNTGGNGSYTQRVPAMHAIATHESPLVQFVHDQLIKIDPAPHAATFLPPVMIQDQAAFCSSCHKVHLDHAVNDYRWLRGFNTYDNWQASGVSGEGARSFYQPPEPRRCTDCHMPLVQSNDPGSAGGVMKDHRFLAANTALPVANKDSVHREMTLAFLEGGHLTVDIMSLSEVEQTEEVVEEGGLVRDLTSNTTFAVGEEAAMGSGRIRGGKARELVAPLQDTQTVLEPGTTYRLDVIVRSRNVGHFFPTGTTDAQEAWLEVRIESGGETLLHSGFVRDGIVDSTAHFYRSVLVDAAGNRIDKRNAFAARTGVYVNLIPPGSADVAHYEFTTPDEWQGPVRIEATLKYRKFELGYTQFAFGGTFDEEFDGSSGHFSRDERDWTYNGVDEGVSSSIPDLPEIPIARMAFASIDLMGLDSAGDPSVDAPDDPATPSDEAAAMRWNDYGISLMREGDLATASRAFAEVTRLTPEYADGWVNRARVYAAEGAWDSAASMVDSAMTRQPDYYKGHYFGGVVAMRTGALDMAESSFEKVLETHPRDRVVWDDLGRTRYLNGNMRGAEEAFLTTLTIDAENLPAHYNLMLIYEALEDAERAAAHRLRYERYKADESATAISRAYRAANPADNNEANAIHVHR